MRPETPEPLKLVALDEDDLKILSAHLQDAVLRMSDMAWVPSEHRFAAILNRFDWLAAVEGGAGSNLRRCRCALRFRQGEARAGAEHKTGRTVRVRGTACGDV